MTLSNFSCTCWPFVCLGKTVCIGPLPIFSLGYLFLNRMSSSYILDMNPLLGKWFANIFSHPES